MASILAISAKSEESLSATVKGLKLIDKSMQAQVRKATAELGTGEWQAEVAQHLQGNALQSAVLGSSNKLSVSNQNVMLLSGASNQKMRGGASPAMLARQEEFGANRGTFKAYRRRSRKGRVTNVLRHTTHQLMPWSPGHKGWAVYPAASQIIPRMASLWVKTAMRTIYEAFEGKSS